MGTRTQRRKRRQARQLAARGPLLATEGSSPRYFGVATVTKVGDPDERTTLAGVLTVSAPEELAHVASQLRAAGFTHPVHVAAVVVLSSSEAEQFTSALKAVTALG